MPKLTDEQVFDTLDDPAYLIGTQGGEVGRFLVSDILTTVPSSPAETVNTIGTLISGANEKTVPIDVDTFGISDSAASNILKKLSWANIKATLKAYFDTVYMPSSIIADVTISGSDTNSTTISGLNITDGAYKLYVQIINNITTGNDLRCWVNSDGNSNYKLSHIERNQGSFATDVGSYSSLGYVTEGNSGGHSYCTYEATLSMNNGIFQVQSFRTAIRGDNTVYGFDMRSFSRTATLSSVTQLVIKTDANNCIGVGSRFVLVKIF